MNELQVTTMIDLQDRMNSKVNPEWKTAGSEWMRAVMVEGVEGLESLGWKWWKKQTPDRANMRMELIDIWHFIVSKAIITSPSEEDCIYLLTHKHDTTLFWAFAGASQTPDIMALDEHRRWDLLIGFAALHAPLYQIVAIFQALQVDAGLSDDDLYQIYLTKNVLNIFRQDNGYKQGTYVKDWFGEEDNVWLERIAASLGAEMNAMKLHDALQTKYDEVLAALALDIEATLADSAPDNSYQLKA